MTQKATILEMLRRSGNRGVSNFELNDVAFRYSARINELRNEGHNIVKRRGMFDKEWVYILADPVAA